MAAQITTGKTWSSEQCTAAKLNLMMSGATIANIDQTNMATNTRTVQVGTSAPSDTDSMWYDTNNDVVKYYDRNTSTWTQLGGSVTSVVDGDADTKIQVEEAADEDKVRMDVAGSEAFVLDNTSLTLALQPMCSGYMAGAQTGIVTNTYTTMEFDTEYFDVGSDFNTGTYTYTVPADGKYLINLSGSIVNLNQDVYMAVAILVGGVIKRRSLVYYGGNSQTKTTCISALLNLSGSDTVTFQIAHNHGSDRQTLAGAYDWFSIAKLA